MKKSINILSLEETNILSEKFGQHLRGGECIEFVSDLGGGKTTFIKGLVDGLGTNDNVSSPTFTIAKQYQTDKYRVYHFDFYRLQEPGLISGELVEALHDSSGVVLVEWGQTVSNVLPKNRIIIEISKLPDSEHARVLEINIPEKYSYLLQGLEN